MLLDSAAGQVRDAKLFPVKSNTQKIGEALASVFEIQRSICKQAPELQLEAKYEQPPEKVTLANRRLGEAMLAADALADEGRLEEARGHLATFATNEPSEHHANLALRQAARYADRDDA